MRHATPEEQADYEAMIARISSPLFTEADLKALEDRCNALCTLIRDMRICLRRAEMYGDTYMKCSECELLTADCDFETRMRQLGIEAGCHRTPEEPPMCCDHELDDSAMLRLHDRMNVVLKRLGANDVHDVADAHEIVEDAARIGREGR